MPTACHSSCTRIWSRPRLAAGSPRRCSRRGGAEGREEAPGRPASRAARAAMRRGEVGVGPHASGAQSGPPGPIRAAYSWTGDGRLEAAVRSITTPFMETRAHARDRAEVPDPLEAAGRPPVQGDDHSGKASTNGHRELMNSRKCRMRLLLSRWISRCSKSFCFRLRSTDCSAFSTAAFSPGRSRTSQRAARNA